MSRTLGTVVRGVRAPIFREGDSVVDITVSTVLNALAENNITARDGDVVAVTESVVARCQGNYATCEQIAEDVRARTGGKTVGVAFPILSRNRFSLLLRGIAMGAEKVVLLLSYPSDEVGNHLVSLDQLDEAGIDPWHDVLSLEQFRAAFGEVVHPFTGVDYVAYYKSIIEEAGAQAEIVFANRVTAIPVSYTHLDVYKRQEQGSMELNDDNVAVKRAFFRKSKLHILLCDSRKFGQRFFYNLFSLQEIDFLVTDRCPENRLYRELLGEKLDVYKRQSKYAVF